MQQGYERGKEFSINEILEFDANKTKFIPHDADDGPRVNIYGSMRIQNFRVNGLTCTTCGLVASKCFAERNLKNTTSYHINLYGYKEDGTEVLFTKDHILPVAFGGQDFLNNMQTMCSECNTAKKHLIPQALPVRFFKYLQIKKNNSKGMNEFDQKAQQYANKLKEFADSKCTGKQYKSCVDSPCKYASASGCTHAKHPKNTQGLS